MANHIVMNGMTELRNALRNLPAEFTEEAKGIITSAAEGAKAEIASAYPTGPQGSRKSNSGRPPGGLKRGVTVKVEASSTFGVVARVKSNAPHAHLYEFGSQQRYTADGASRGRMPEAPRPVFVPTVIRRRRTMFDELLKMVRRAGLDVTGTP